MTAFVVLMGATVVAGLGGISRLPVSSTPDNSAANPQNAAASSTREIAFGCTSDELTKFHIHPHLTIIIDGKEWVIPADIGITPDCQRAIHTHDTSGTIHIESPVVRDFVLGDFFAVWGETFSQNQILDHKADATHAVTMTVDGQLSAEYGNLVLKDNQQIVIEYRKM